MQLVPEWYWKDPTATARLQPNPWRRQPREALLWFRNLSRKTILRLVERVGGDRCLEERADLRLGVGVLRAEVPRGVTVRLGDADDVDVRVVSGLEEVLALEVVRTRRVHGRPRGTDLTLGEELTRREDVLRLRLVGRRRRALEALDGRGVASERVGEPEGRTRLRDRAREAEAASLLHPLGDGSLDSRLSIQQKCQGDDSAKNNSDAVHGFGHRGVCIPIQTNFNNEKECRVATVDSRCFGVGVQPGNSGGFRDARSAAAPPTNLPVSLSVDPGGHGTLARHVPLRGSDSFGSPEDSAREAVRVPPWNDARIHAFHVAWLLPEVQSRSSSRVREPEAVPP